MEASGPAAATMAVPTPGSAAAPTPVGGPGPAVVLGGYRSSGSGGGAGGRRYCRDCAAAIAEMCPAALQAEREQAMRRIQSHGRHGTSHGFASCSRDQESAGRAAGSGGGAGAASASAAGPEAVISGDGGGYGSGGGALALSGMGSGSVRTSRRRLSDPGSGIASPRLSGAGGEASVGFAYGGGGVAGGGNDGSGGRMYAALPTQATLGVLAGSGAIGSGAGGSGGGGAGNGMLTAHASWRSTGSGGGGSDGGTGTLGRQLSAGGRCQVGGGGHRGNGHVRALRGGPLEVPTEGQPETLTGWALLLELCICDTDGTQPRCGHRRRVGAPWRCRRWGWRS